MRRRPEDVDVDHEEIGGQQAAQHTFSRVVGAGLVDQLQQVIASQKEHTATGTTRAVTKSAGEKGLAHADGAEGDHVLAVEERQPEKIADAVAVEVDGRITIEVLEDLLFGNSRPDRGGC